jgi:hypothetical protein
MMTDLRIMQLEDPEIDFYKEGKCVMYAVRELISGDQCEGGFVSGLAARSLRPLMTRINSQTMGQTPRACSSQKI